MTAAKKPSTAKKAAAKTAAKKATPRKSAAKSSSSKSSATKTSQKSAAAKKSAAKPAAAKKTAAKATPAKKSAPKKTAAQSTAAKATPKKTAARATAGRTVSKPTVRSSSSAAHRAATKPPAKTTRAPRPAKLDKKTLATIRAQLVTKKTEMEQRQAELQEDSFDGTQSDITGEVGLDEDFADAGTATFERERDLSIRNNIADLIDQMSRAIQRIDDGTYGTCERCGRPIDAPRLKELPHALLCLDCKRREERAR
jgi:RNA polymerase-binding protein DksA